jgi:hypothetical protein
MGAVKQRPQEIDEIRVRARDLAGRVHIRIVFGTAVHPDDLALVEDAELGRVAGAAVDLMDAADVRLPGLQRIRQASKLVVSMVLTRPRMTKPDKTL